MKEYYEYTDSKSSKFWEFSISEGESAVHVRFGKIGTDGQKQTKEFDSHEAALAFATKTAKSKTKKGYVLKASETQSDDATKPTAVRTPPKPKAKKTKGALDPEVEALDALLISPDLANRELGLTMLETRDPEQHVAALMFVSNSHHNFNRHKIPDQELKQRRAHATRAAEFIKTLKKPPKGANARYSFKQEYARFVFEDGREPVIRALIQEVLEDDGEFRLDEARLRSLPDCLADYQQIDDVCLRDSYFQEFPAVLLALKNLKYLNLYASKIAELPEAFYDLDMHQVELERNKITAISPSVAKWKNLETLDLYVNPIRELPEEVILLPKLRNLRVEKTEMPASQVQNLFAWLFKTKAADVRRLVQWNLVFGRNERAVEVGNYDEFISAFDSPVPLVRANAALALDHWLARPAPAARRSPLGDGHVLTVIGKLTTKTAELKDRLGVHGVKVTNKLDEKTTHLAIGEKPGKKLLEALDWPGPVLTDAAVVAFLNQTEKPFLLDATEDTGGAKENLGEMLASRDEDTVRLALTMMKSSGVPDDLKTDLFATYQLGTNKKNKTLAKELLLQVASPTLTQVLAKRQNFPAATEKKISEYITTFCADGEIDAMRLVRRLLNHGRLGIKYATEHGDAELRRAALQAMVEDGVLDLYDRHLTVLPTEIGDIQGVHTLRLEHSTCTELPASVGKLAGLKKLQISSNRIKTLPPELGELAALEYLDIAGNKIKALPPELAKLTSLKVLDIGHNPLKELPGFLGQLKMLETLNLGYLNLKVFPEALFDLPKLKKLVLCDDPFPDYPADLSRLSSVEEIDLTSSKFEVFPAGLATLPNLRELELTFCKEVQDLSPIAEIKSLRKLSMQWARRQSKQLNALQAAMPDCTFDV